MQMNRRNALRTIGGGTLAVGVGAAFKCSPATQGQLEKWGNLVADEIAAVGPELLALGLPHAALVAQAEKIARDFVAAVKASDNVKTLDLLGQLTAPDGLINQIASDAGLIKDANTKKFVEGALLIAHVTLALIAANIQQNVPASAKATATAAGHGKQAASVERAASAGSIEAMFRVAYAH